MQQQQGFSIGRSTEISRDEVKFNKFIVRLRKKFSMLFSHALRVQLIAKNVIKPEEWDDIQFAIKYDYLEDNHYSELKDSEILQQRMGLLQLMDPYIGKYYSMEWARKNVLHLDEKEIKEIDQQIENEKDQMIANAETQGQIQLAMQQPQMDAQAQQQQAMQQQQPQQDQGAPDQQEADAEAEQDAGQDTDTQQSKGKVTKLKTGTWPN
jgi:hypothetical protein